MVLFFINLRRECEFPVDTGVRFAFRAFGMGGEMERCKLLMEEDRRDRE